MRTSRFTLAPSGLRQREAALPAGEGGKFSRFQQDFFLARTVSKSAFFKIFFDVIHSEQEVHLSSCTEEKPAVCLLASVSSVWLSVSSAETDKIKHKVGADYVR